MNIKAIIFGGFVANCYLIQTETGFILIDTGRESKRRKLDKELDRSGCNPGDLKLIILTHGDFDHTGNCVYLGNKYGAKIVMHESDAGMVERADMFWNRKSGNSVQRKIVNTLFGIRKFKPDFTIDESFDFSDYGLDAKVLHLPGHSKGSIGILTSNNELFCGDLFTNTAKPELNSIMDDSDEANASIEKVKKLDINTVYPGHGKPFLWKEYTGD